MRSETVTPNEQPSTAQRPRRALRPWIKRLGWVGFLVFFIKGAAWLIVPWLLYLSSGC